MHRLLGSCSRALCDFAGWLLAAMALLINVEIAARYFFNTSTLIADEYSGYLFVWATLLGFGHALHSGQFLKVEALVARLGPRGHALTALLSAITGLAVAVVCVYATWALVAASWRFGSRSIQPSSTPLAIPELLLPLGFAWLCVLYVDQALVAGKRLFHRPASAEDPAGRSAVEERDRVDRRGTGR